jgi:aspartate aminotransferase
MLADAGKRNGRTIYLISDEAYRNIIFDGRPYHSPVAFYPESFLVYTYGKVLLAPGQRIGYIALPPDMTDRRQLRAAIPAIQMVNG